MDHLLSDHTRRLGKEARAFAQADLGAGDWRALWTKAAGYGLLGVALPQDCGGAGTDIQTAVHILENIGHGCPDNGFTFGLNAQIWSMQMPLFAFGSDAQKERYLKPMIKGGMICSHAITEAASGSDAMAMQATAVATDDGYVLNGEKVMIGMAPVCDVAMVFASTDPSRGAWGISAFLVDADLAGFHRGDPVEKMGTQSMPFGSITLSDCHVPKDALLGRVGAGQSIFNASLDWERRFIFASQVGAMERMLDACVDHAGSREVFGAPIKSHQSVSNRLADMALRTQTARMFLYRAASEVDAGKADPLTASMTKLAISEAYLANSVDAIRNFGGAGYLRQTGIEAHLRDAMGGVIYGGTSDIQRQIIASLLNR